MNTIVTLNRLTVMLSEMLGISINDAADFINSFTLQISEGLKNDGRVEVKGLGVFSVDGLSRDRITFMPSDYVASTVNAPFAMFEAEVLDDRFEDAPEPTPEPELVVIPEPEPEPVVAPEPTHEPPVIPEPVAVPEPTPESPVVAEPVVAPEPTPEPPIVHEPVIVSEPTPEPPIVPEPDPEPEPTPGPEPKPTLEPQAEMISHTHSGTEDSHARRRSSRSFTSYVVMLTGFVLLSFIIGAVAGYFSYPLINYLMSESQTQVDVTVESVEPAPVDTQTELDEFTSTISADETTADAQAEQPQADDDPTPAPSRQAVVTDTVEAGNSLAKIAKTHYGKSDFWVYIYLENSDRLGNPDNIASGTILVIPPAEKYDIDPNDTESVKAARAKASEIYRNYR